MSGRLPSLGFLHAGLALIVALAGAIAASCYEVPRPACGFVCGPEDACPDGYRCAADHYCHREDAPDGLVCTRPDAALPVDAMLMPDVPDAMPDGP